MSLARARAGAKRAIDSSQGNRRSKQGKFDRYFPPKLTGQIASKLSAKDTIAEPIIFVRGSYPDYLDAARHEHEVMIEPDFHYAVHRTPRKGRGGGGGGGDFFDDEPCSAGPEMHSPEPCVYCKLDSEGRELRRSEQWCWNIIHLGLYHRVPLLSRKTGEIMKKEGSEEPIMVTKECYANKRISQITRRDNCDYCQKGEEIHFGAHRWLGVGYKHQTDCIAQWQAEVSQICRFCKTSITEVGFDCSNPKCGQPLLDLENSEMTDDEMFKFTHNKAKCPKCGLIDFPEPSYQCGFDENGERTDKGCSDDVRSAPRNLFDYVFWVQREGEKSQSAIKVVKKRLITSFKQTIFAGTDAESEVTMSPELMEYLCPTPYDFTAFLGPESTQEQAKRLGVADPFGQQDRTEVQRPRSYQPPVGTGRKSAPRPKLASMPGVTPRS